MLFLWRKVGLMNERHAQKLIEEVHLVHRAIEAGFLALVSRCSISPADQARLDGSLERIKALSEKAKALVNNENGPSGP